MPGRPKFGCLTLWHHFAPCREGKNPNCCRYGGSEQLRCTTLRVVLIQLSIHDHSIYRN